MSCAAFFRMEIIQEFFSLSGIYGFVARLACPEWTCLWNRRKWSPSIHLLLPLPLHSGRRWCYIDIHTCTHSYGQFSIPNSPHQHGFLTVKQSHRKRPDLDWTPKMTVLTTAQPCRHHWKSIKKNLVSRMKKVLQTCFIDYIRSQIEEGSFCDCATRRDQILVSTDAKLADVTSFWLL